MALKKNKSITELRLDYNSIKDEGVIALAEAVYEHRNLSVLGLAGNNIGRIPHPNTHTNTYTYTHTSLGSPTQTRTHTHTPTHTHTHTHVPR